jgi:hypothetical protein
MRIVGDKPLKKVLRSLPYLKSKPFPIECDISYGINGILEYFPISVVNSDPLIDEMHNLVFFELLKSLHVVLREISDQMQGLLNYQLFLIAQATVTDGHNTAFQKLVAVFSFEAREMGAKDQGFHFELLACGLEVLPHLLQSAMCQKIDSFQSGYDPIGKFQRQKKQLLIH